MQKSTGRPRTPPPRNDAVLLATAISLGDAAVAELRGLRADVRELIAVLRTQRTPAIIEHKAELSEKLPTMMTIAEAAEMLRTSSRSLYQRIRRGVMPGVVRVGPRRLMVKTDEFLREFASAADSRLNRGSYQALRHSGGWAASVSDVPS